MFEYRIIAAVDRDCHGHMLDQVSHRIDAIRNACLSMAGGFTEYAHVGGWANEDGSFARESGRTWSVFLASGEAGEDTARSIAAYVRAQLKQASVCLILPGGRVAFI